MAKYSRESRLRAVRAGHHPPIMCATCGQSFWTYDQKTLHHSRTASGLGVCLYVAHVEKPAPSQCDYCGDRPSSLMPCPECGA
jgi:primosomal protein N'